MKLTILGSGRWASFLAWYGAKTGHETLMWARPGSKTLAGLRETGRNEYVELPPSVGFTEDLSRALGFGDIILVAISAQKLRELLASLPARPGVPLVLCMKGIESGTGLRLTEVAAECLGDGVPAAVWVGPGHPQDFVDGIPNCMVIDSPDAGLTRRVADSLSSPLIRFYYGQDLIGAEIGAAAKNVVGIAAGMLDGLGLGSLKGVLMARGAREISRLTARLGGNELTAYGLCHLGDYGATLFSPYSHNRRFGESLILGRPYNELAEGVATADSLLTLSEKTGVDLPICRAVADIISGRQKPKEALEGLFMRSVKPEFYL